ncbi:unnamed protein product [Chrysoparadoxa australica]
MAYPRGRGARGRGRGRGRDPGRGRGRGRGRTGNKTWTASNEGTSSLSIPSSIAALTSAAMSSRRGVVRPRGGGPAPLPPPPPAPLEALQSKVAFVRSKTGKGIKRLDAEEIAALERRKALDAVLAKRKQEEAEKARVDAVLKGAADRLDASRPPSQELAGRSSSVYRSRSVGAPPGTKEARGRAGQPKARAGEAAASAAQQHCIFYTRYGKCEKEGSCPYIHDPSAVAVCKLFLKGACCVDKCLLSHHADAGKMPVCSFFLRGVCTTENCPYRHVKVNREAAPCPEFQKLGYCPRGESCHLQHVVARSKRKREKKDDDKEPGKAARHKRG